MARRALLIAALAAAAAAAVVVAVAALRDDGARGAGGAVPARTAAAVDRFDGARAWAELRRQVALGPRPAGSAASRRLAGRLRRALPRGRFEAVPGHLGLRNVTGVLPGRRPAVLVAAHYDTKDLPGFVGANDGAGGTAAVLELARVLRGLPRSREIRFALFDGEEAADDTRPFEATGLRGSRAYARRHAGAIATMVLLDFVAARDLRIRREASSDPRLWAQLRAAALRVGAAGAFPAGFLGAITDDHTPFLRRGVRAIDLIGWPYPCWHRRCDDLSAVDPRSLDRAGETVLELVRTLVN